LCSATDNPAICKVRAVIRYLRAKNTSAAEICLELCAAVYDQDVMMKELQDNGAECSKMGEQMFTMKSEVVGHL
jgi:putative IMPACT (imprinted ancient) family translation regulator